MRVAMYESLYRSDIPTRVAVNEAVAIAKKYETPDTVKFINGILGSFCLLYTSRSCRCTHLSAGRPIRTRPMRCVAALRGHC